MSVCGLSVCGQFVCVRVCDYAAKPFCAASYFLGAAPSKSPVKQHSDINHSANISQGSAGTFRSVKGLTFRDRFDSLLAQWTREFDHNS